MLSIITKARIINYDSRIIIYSFIVLATVIKIVNYNCTVIMIVNYDRKTFIVQATDLATNNFKTLSQTLGAVIVPNLWPVLIKIG